MKLFIIYLALLIILSYLRLSSAAKHFTVYYRQRSNGTIWTYNSANGEKNTIPVDGSEASARILGIAIDQRSDRMYWSTGKVIKSAQVDGTDPKLVIGSIARVTWYGVNFGAVRTDLLGLQVKGTHCLTVTKWSPTEVECLVGLPMELSTSINSDDCIIRTVYGEMKGSVRNVGEMRAAGYKSPLVSDIQIVASSVSPHALAISTSQSSEPWLYWSNAADGNLYRSNLRTSAIEILQMKMWSVRGMAATNESLFFSLESKGIIMKMNLEDPEFPVVPFLLGLHAPRGITVDPEQKHLYFVEKIGKLYKARVDGNSIPDMDGSSANFIKIQTLTSITRLDGISVDESYIYWCESNTNVIARSPLDRFTREVVVGGSANSMLSWPRSIALLRGEYYYSEYVGRISRGGAQSVIINELKSPNMIYIDDAIQSGDSDGHVHFYALE